MVGKVVVVHDGHEEGHGDVGGPEGVFPFDEGVFLVIIM